MVLGFRQSQPLKTEVFFVFVFVFPSVSLPVNQNLESMTV